MRIILILMCGLLLQNCSNKNAKIKSPNDLKSFVNDFCTSPKNTSTEKVIKVCASEFSKDLNIAENKSLLNAKLKLKTTHLYINSLIQDQQETFLSEEQK